MARFWKNILALLVNPSRGWEDVSHDGDAPSELCRRVFYPLLAVTALSSFCMLYHFDTDEAVTFVDVIQQAIITFTAFFATQYFAQFVFSLTLGKISDRYDNTNNAATFTIYNLAILAVICIIGNVVPIDIAVIKFLPLYLIFIIWKGRAYMAVGDDRAGQFMLLSVGIIVFPIYFIFFLFGLAGI